MIPLPSLAQLDRGAPRIWLATAATELRRGFDRLAEMARSVIGRDPRSGHLFDVRSRGGETEANSRASRAHADATRWTRRSTSRNRS